MNQKPYSLGAYNTTELVIGIILPWGDNVGDVIQVANFHTY